MKENLLKELRETGHLTEEKWYSLLSNPNETIIETAKEMALELRKEVFGKKVYIRGLIEISNICSNDCYYCGIRSSNHKLQRYRLTKDEIVECAKTGYELGFRTFVLQGGEKSFRVEEIEAIIAYLREHYKDCGITLSLGEYDKAVYERWKKAGANRYLLRHETGCQQHYQYLHPEKMSWEHRIACLHWLKELSYQVGCGFMVGSPGQTIETLTKDMMLIQELKPEMVGIGPFIPHKDTPFRTEEAGKVRDTLYYLSLIRIMLPQCLLPATTALGTLEKNGRQEGILSGANVVMPNLSPKKVRKKYALYDNKISTNQEAAEGIALLKKEMEEIGYEIVVDRGDAPKRR